MTQSTVRSRLVRFLSPVGTSLREGWLGVTFTILLAAAALGLFAALQSLRTTEPVLAPIGTASSLVHWTQEASPPSVTQAAAIHSLIELLMAIAWTAMVLGMLTVLVRYQVLAARRGSELGVRRAVGASRVDILAALLAESGVTGLLAAALGAASAAMLLIAARAFWPEASFGAWPPLLPGAAIVGAVLLVGGLSPLRFLRARYLTNQEQGTVPLGFPTFQLAISLTLVMGSALLLAKGREQKQVAGPRASGIVVQFDSGLTEQSDRASVYLRLLDRLRVEAGPVELSLTSPGGLVGLGTVDNVTTHCGQCVSGGIFVPFHHTQAVHLFVSPDSFAARGAKVVAGRALTEADRWGEKRVAVVNRHLALRHFESGDAVGREVWLGSDLRREPYEVVGIVEDSGSDVLGGALQPRQAVYLSVLQLPPREADLLVRGSGPVDSAAVLAAIRDTIGAGVVRSVSREGDYLAAQMGPLSWFGGWFALAGLVVLFTGTAGTFSTVRLWVDSLAAELSLRRAVGANRFRIASFVLIRALGIGVGGTALGVFLYFVVLRGALEAVVRDLPVWNPNLLLAVTVLFGGVSLAAAALPTFALLRRPPKDGMTE